ncbi:hypothetical protein LPB136_02620 [Tenacibaculum todarodis]|uniref:DUF6438 domain-containing protein n=1 Tax=Tenacibaculum todarodis TaxID=1850252 RepID=A0A1L3JGT9_9FLAO|nr:DUF6438 domain-containing protein [Tenacibaculum todarodis]APG64330.1 hypothetical protein LPB136_02620 [Tenacibaculum todarodis]
MKSILLSVFLLALSCGSPKKVVKETKKEVETEVETKIEGTTETPKVITEEIIAVLKYPNRMEDAKQLVVNSGLTWDKLIFNQDDTKIALLKVPADKSNFWIERLMTSGEFKSVELNKELTLNKIISDIETTFVSLRKTQCYGHCPVFDVKIDKQGNVFYNGIKYVLVKGKKSFKLTDKQFSKLKNMLGKTSFSKYRIAYNNPRISDLPSTYISHNNKEIQLRVWGEVPTELVQVTEYIEDILLAKKFYEL